MNFLTLNDVCALIHIKVTTGRNRLSLGSDMPPSFRIGRRRLFDEAVVQQWLEQQAKSKTKLNRKD